MQGTCLFVLTTAIGLLLCAATPMASAGGDDGVLRIDSRTALVGELVPVTLEAIDIPQLVGAWTIDIQYDPDVIAATECVAYYGGVCSTAFRADTLRVIGASRTGLTGDFDLATFVFRCAERRGTTDLTIEREIWGSGIPEDPPLASTIVDGAISCEEPATETSAPQSTATPRPGLPPTGAGADSASFRSWPFLLLVLASVAFVLSVFAVRRRA